MQHSSGLSSAVDAAGLDLLVLLVFLVISFLRHTWGVSPSQMRRDLRTRLLAALMALVFLLVAGVSILGVNLR
jgi:hypothetical protein